MHSPERTKRFPALRSKIGDWYYYVTTLPLREVADRVQPASELVNPADISEWVQRTIIEGRARSIGDYLVHQPEHFFPSIVVGVYLGEPTWYEINVEGNIDLSDSAVDDHARNKLGLLELDGTERLYAIDGQHRVAGIQVALDRLKSGGATDEYEKLANEDLAIMFVSADIEREGQRERVRRLFTTLNKEAKRVTEQEIIALDEDDAAAIVTRRIATDYKGFRNFDPPKKGEQQSLLQFGRQDELRPSDKRHFTTIVTLYRTVKKIFQAELRDMERRSQKNRPDEADLSGLYNQAVAVWDMLREHDEALGDVLGSDPNEDRAGKYRTEQGGHVLFRPVGLQVFAGALGVLRSRGITDEKTVEHLCKIPTEISRPPWVHILWNPNSRNMVTSNRVIAEALYLHMLSESPRSKNYDLRKRYAEALGEPTGNPLTEVPVNPIR